MAEPYDLGTEPITCFSWNKDRKCEYHKIICISNMLNFKSVFIKIILC